MVFGISIGSTTLSNAVVASGRAQVVANADGHHRPRAVVAKVENEFCVGTAALSARNTPLFKNILKEFIENGPTHMIQCQGKDLRVDVCLAALIRECVSTCRNFNTSAESVSIIIPDEFSEEQEKQFVKIFETVSEMKVTRPIRRSAAALVAARQNGALEEQEIQKGSKNVLVVRIGGLSTTGTLYRETNGLLTKLKQSHKQTGADVIVKHLTDYLVREANRKFRCDLSESKKSMSKVEQEARRAIEVLSNKDSVNVQIDSCFEGMDFQMVVNRSRVTMTAPYKSVLEGLFSDFEGETIEEILMCGGAAKSPQFQKIVQGKFSNVTVLPNAEELIPLGAAIQCHITSSGNKLSINEIPRKIALSSFSLLNGSETVIEKGTPLPLSFTTNNESSFTIPEIGEDVIFSSENHVTGNLNEKGLFFTSGEKSFEMLF